MRQGLALALAVAVAIPGISGCGPDGAPADAVAAATSAESKGASAPEAVRPREIYYDLTAFAWYQAGAPLVVDGRAYVARGAPLTSSSAKLRLAGTYQGVDYYRDAEISDVVYVPVFEKYWQPFVLKKD
jgi:hypothetical protein